MKKKIYNSLFPKKPPLSLMCFSTTEKNSGKGEIMADILSQFKDKTHTNPTFCESTFALATSCCRQQYLYMFFTLKK